MPENGIKELVLLTLSSDFLTNQDYLSYFLALQIRQTKKIAIVEYLCPKLSHNAHIFFIFFARMQKTRSGEL